MRRRLSGHRALRPRWQSRHAWRRTMPVPTARVPASVPAIRRRPVRGRRSLPSTRLLGLCQWRPSFGPPSRQSPFRAGGPLVWGSNRAVAQADQARVAHIFVAESATLLHRAAAPLPAALRLRAWQRHRPAHPARRSKCRVPPAGGHGAPATVAFATELAAAACSQPGQGQRCAQVETDLADLLRSAQAVAREALQAPRKPARHPGGGEPAQDNRCY